MINRTRIGTQVYEIANQYGVPQTMVYEIISCYLRYCKDLLIYGNQIDFYGLVSIVPNVRVSKYATTLAYECEKVASALSLPSYTVYVVVDTYIQDAIEKVKSGIIVEIRGIVTIKPLFDLDGNIISVRSSVSQTLKLCLDSNTPVTGFRVHTCKYLRDQIKGVAQ